MKNLLHNWPLRRIIYLVGGLWMIVQAVMDRLWIFLPLGIYFMGMSIFKFGCASGNCAVEQPKENP